jgi:hypothetical protein
LADADLVVIETVIATGVQTTKTLTTHYTVSGEGNPAGGSVTMLTAPASTVTLTIYRDPSAIQDVDLVEGDPLPVETAVERPLDKLTMIVQRVKELIERSLRLPEGDTGFVAADMYLPAEVDRASKYLGFDANGKPIATAGTTDATVHSAFIETLHDDANAATARATLGSSAVGDAVFIAATAAAARTTLGAVGLTGAESISGVKTFTDGFTLAAGGTGSFAHAAGSFTVEVITDADVNGAKPMLSFYSADNPELKLHIAEVTGGTRVYLWDDTVALPNVPHTAIPPTFAVYGDILVGDIVALEDNPMTYFIRASSTNLDPTKTTQFFCHGAVNSDTRGGAGIIMAPDDGSSADAGYLRLVAYGHGGGGGFENTIRFATRDGAGTVADRVLVTEGVRVGSPTGGDKGVGTINVSADIYKNDGAYANPDYVFERAFTGRVEKFASNPGASEYAGLLPLTEVEAFAKSTYQLPRVSAVRGMFERGDILLEKVEEIYLYLFDHEKRLQNAEAKHAA